jgi:SAM-dependent methyltransferase
MAPIVTATDYILYLRDVVTGRRFNSERSCALDRCNELLPYIDMNTPRDVLDLGCGRLEPQSIIFSRWGHRVTGVDRADIQSLTLTNIAYAMLRSSLCYSTPKRAPSSGCLTFVNADVGDLPFEDESFDVIISASAFEHFLEVPKVISEMKRVLRPQGVFTVDIHIFTSLSGGHTIGMRMDPAARLPKGIEPWDHLRDRRLRASVPLNEWRMTQYLDAFRAEFTVLKSYVRSTEGREFLTDDVREALKDYAEDELTAACYRIVGMKGS